MFQLREVGKKFEDLAVRRGSKMKTINPKSYQKKVTKMSLGLIFVFVFCNSFLQIYFILQGAKILAGKDIASIYLYPTALVFTTLNSSINVIFYSIYNPEFKTTFICLFCPCSEPESVVLVDTLYLQNFKEPKSKIKITAIYYILTWRILLIVSKM